LEVTKPPLHPQGFPFYLKIKTARRLRGFFAKLHRVKKTPALRENDDNDAMTLNGDNDSMTLMTIITP
jgi:hypothetical protein